MNLESILPKLIISNIKNYLKEIENPKEEDKIRWPMELIQNAKDSLYLGSNIQQQKQVSISIEIKGNLDNIEEVIFSHDGPPFTQDSYEGLMYKISQGKDDNKKTTGQFGTGFITTHVLSKIVYISGDIIEKDNNINGFSVVMYREGRTNEEILSDCLKMSNSYKTESNRFNLTTFKYQTKTKQSKQCAKLGIANLKNHIWYVLTNCPDIKCFKLILNGRHILYSVSTSNGNPNLYTITASSDRMNEKRYFLKFDHKPVDITVEIDDKYNIIPKGENIECLYAVFPLIGTGSHILPFSINSPEFEPSTERNNLPLLGEIAEVASNKNLLLTSLALYENLIDELLKNNCSNIYQLARGLNLDKCPYKSFDLVWYEENFLKPMRNILSKKVKVKTCSNNCILLSDVYFPAQINKRTIKQFLDLSVIRKYYPNMIEYHDFMLWKDYIWATSKMVSINDLLERVQNDKSLFDEPQLNTFNEVLKFVWKYDKNILHNKALIPDINNELKCFSIDGIFMKECKKVSHEIIEIMESVNIPWKSTHVNNKINSIRFDEDDETDAEKKIANEFQKLIESNRNTDLQMYSYCMMKFVLENDEKREKMFQIASKIDDFPYNNSDIIYVSKVNPIIWKHADDFVLKKAIDIIQKYDSYKIESELDYIKKIIFAFKVHFKFEPEFVNSTKIIPNAKNELKCLNELFNQSTKFHDHFSPKIKEFFDIDLNDRIINPEVNQIIKSEKNEKITDFLNIIDEKINTEDFDKYLPIAELVLSIIPSKNQQQIEIFNKYKLFKPSIKEILIDEDDFSLKYYNKVNQIVLTKLCQFVEESGSLQKYQENYSLNEDEAFNSLNMLYDRFDEGILNHSIIPNKEGKFMKKEELRNDPKIDEKLFELYKKLDQNSDSQEDHLIDLQKIVHPKVKIDGIENFDVFGFCKALNKKIKTVVSNPNVDREILRLINDCIDIDFANVTGDDMSEEQKVRMNILHNAHISFIKNRIRELSSPKDSDFQRWPFELIQNATDCIQDSSEKIYNEEYNGHISFIFNEDEVIFKHFGAPFTHRNLISLLYQYGGEKEGKSKIGKFGTGFLSTMILTRKVIIKSDFQKEDGSIEGFTVTIDRSGNTTEELLSYIGSMEKSLKTGLEKTGGTKFVFKLPEKTEENKNCYRAYDEGLKSLIKYIAPSLIFNPKIKSITIKSNNLCHFYALYKDNDNNEEEEDIENNCIKTIKIIKARNGLYRSTDFRQFIYESSQKLFNDKNIKVECLLEIGSKKRDIIATKEFLFLHFPMFGKKEFGSPIIINSPDFEPETERNDIIINSKQLKEISSIVDSSIEKVEEDHADDKLTSINKFIIYESVNLFKIIIKHVQNIGCVDLFNICSGLKYNSTVVYINGVIF
ncbi:hypothetical protein M9Y10_015621 [Tritrichomonas musculus]|uniref:Histidine kinase/HSP90-like ATPase domain-containing protein n=1 Tax=Tritrichomonas musculus TaxID=1915356 RepID=A0ABR2L2W0_9EUKA